VCAEGYWKAPGAGDVLCEPKQDCTANGVRYVAETNTCESCTDAHCWDCSSNKDICNLCEDQWMLDEVKNCKKAGCAEGEYWLEAETSCKACTAGCLKCMNGNSCSSCEDTGIYCQGGYRYDANSVAENHNEKCVECLVAGCEDCDGESQGNLVCNKCFRGYKLQDNSCVVDDTAKPCASGFYLNKDTGNCAACAKGCNQCTDA